MSDRDTIAALQRNLADIEAERLRLVEALEKAVALAQRYAETADMNARAVSVEFDRAEKAEAELAEWATKDGNSPGYNLEKARTYGRIAAEERQRAEKAEAERDEARAERDEARAEVARLQDLHTRCAAFDDQPGPSCVSLATKCAALREALEGLLSRPFAKPGWSPEWDALVDKARAALAADGEGP